jgi:hypothetical protein
MNTRDILFGAIIIAVIIILGRLIFGSPLVQRVRESFANAPPPALTNKSTECPKGSVFYMYEGTAYCCSGQINGSADSAARSCRPVQGRDASTTFCTLGASSPAAPNCLTLRSGLMQAEAETLCPSTMPTYVQSNAVGDAGNCCGAPGGNADLTTCTTGATTCAVATNGVDADPFQSAGSCQFLKAQEDDGSCPSSFTPIVVPRPDGTTIYGCTNSATNCYLPATLARLRSFGHNVTGLVACT